MFKVCIIGVIAAFLALIVRQQKNEFSIMISLVTGIIIFFYAIKNLTTMFEFINNIISKLPIDKLYLTQLIKMIGVSYCADFSSNLCKDAGYHTISSQIDLFAKLCIMVLSLPGLYYFIEVLEEIW